MCTEVSFHSKILPVVKLCDSLTTVQQSGLEHPLCARNWATQGLLYGIESFVCFPHQIVHSLRETHTPASSLPPLKHPELCLILWIEMQRQALLVCVENSLWTQSLACAVEKASQAFLFITKAVAFVYSLSSRDAFSLVRRSHQSTFTLQILPCARHNRMHFIQLLNLVYVSGRSQARKITPIYQVPPLLLFGKTTLNSKINVFKDHFPGGGRRLRYQLVQEKQS